MTITSLFRWMSWVHEWIGVEGCRPCRANGRHPSENPLSGTGRRRVTDRPHLSPPHQPNHLRLVCAYLRVSLARFVAWSEGALFIASTANGVPHGYRRVDAPCRWGVPSRPGGGASGGIRTHMPVGRWFLRPVRQPVAPPTQGVIGEIRTPTSSMASWRAEPLTRRSHDRSGYWVEWASGPGGANTISG